MRFTQGLEMIKTWCTARNKSVLDNAVAIIGFIERDPGTDVSNMIRCYSTPRQFVEHRLQKSVSWNILLNGLKVKWWEVGLGGKVKDQFRNTRDRIIEYKCEVEDRVEWHELRRLIKHSQALLSFHVMLCLSLCMSQSIHMLGSCDSQRYKSSVCVSWFGFCTWEMFIWSHEGVPQPLPCKIHGESIWWNIFDYFTV